MGDGETKLASLRSIERRILRIRDQRVMLDFDLAEIVLPEEEATPRRGCDSHNVALAFGHQARQSRVILEDVVHFPLQASREALAAATERGAFRADMMENSVGKGEKNVRRLIQYSRHKAVQSITNCELISRQFGPCKRPFLLASEPCKGLGSVYNFRRLGQKTGPKNPATAREVP